MRATTAFIPLFALATTICAVPISLVHSPRSVPDVTAVIRNPTPIDGSKIIGGLIQGVKDILSSGGHGHTVRAALDLEVIAENPVDVVGRSVFVA